MEKMVKLQAFYLFNFTFSTRQDYSALFHHANDLAFSDPEVYVFTDQIFDVHVLYCG